MSLAQYITKSKQRHRRQGSAHLEPTDNRVKEILQRVPDDARVLDVGCVQHNAEMADDRNWLHKHLRKQATDVVGVDYVRDEVRALKDQGYDARHADAEVMDFDEEFDVVVAGELIEHLGNPGAFLDCARKHLSDDGKLILTTPNVWGACYLKRTFLPGEVHCNEEHTSWYDRRTLRQLVERAGFEIEEQTFVKPPFDGEYLSWTCWNVFQNKRFGALTQLLVAKPVSESR